MDLDHANFVITSSVIINIQARWAVGISVWEVKGDGKEVVGVAQIEILEFLLQYKAHFFTF